MEDQRLRRQMDNEKEINLKKINTKKKRKNYIHI